MTDSAGPITLERARVEAILALLERMAAGDTTVSLPLSENGDELDAIAHAVNVLSDELRWTSARMAEALWFGPTNRKVKLAPEVAKYLLATQAQWDSIIPLNLDNLTARREEWIQKYTRALA